MKPASSQQQASFFKRHILPVFFIFLIPSFSAFFFSYAEKATDREILTEIESGINSNTRISDARKSELLDFYRRTPVSRIMASDDLRMADAQAAFSPANLRYTTFRWMQ